MTATSSDQGSRHRISKASARLPSPPTDEEKTSYADRNIALIIRGSLASFGALLISQTRFIASSPALLVFAPFLLFTVAYYVISLCVNAGTKGFDLSAHNRLAASWRPREYPALDIFLPVCGEPLDVLHNTWTHVYYLAKAYPGVVNPCVLDDGADDAVEEMANAFGFYYIVRPNRGWMKKAGNLRYAFSQTTGDYILILDADFAPRVDLPAQLLPYFGTDDKLGIIQSPQYFRTSAHMSWVERGAGAVQELFYRSVQVSRDRHDGAICVGSCAIYRRAALAANGGSSIIEHSEDVHTGFDLRRAGWGLRYIPVPLAVGLCPGDPDSFLVQQYRWCAGSMSLLLSRKFWSLRMRWRTRFCYLSGFCYYVHTALFTFVAPLVPLTMLIFLPEKVRLINYVFIVPSFLYNMIVFPSWHRCRFGPTALMAKLLYGWAHAFAIWDLARRRPMGWQPTGGSARKSKTRRIWIGIAAWNGTTSLAWVLMAIERLGRYGMPMVPLLFTGLVTAGLTAMAMLARRNYARVTGGLE